MEKKKSGWLSEIKGLLWAVLLALVIRSVGFEPYNIPSSSMVPTLLVGDYLFITKYDYGYSRHSFPFSLPIIPSGRIFEKAPERGDIVVFKVPTDNRTDYIEKEGLVHYTKYEETLPNGMKHFIYERSDDKMTDDTDVFFVPSGHYFMLGDNRDNSYDSRFFGFVPAENLEGKARFIFYSNNGNGDFWQFWKWKKSLRLERFFEGLHP